MKSTEQLKKIVSPHLSCVVPEQTVLVLSNYCYSTTPYIYNTHYGSWLCMYVCIILCMYARPIYDMSRGMCLNNNGMTS